MENQEEEIQNKQEQMQVIDQNMDEQEFDVYEPGSVDELLSYLKRNFNALNESNMAIRKKAIINIYERLEKEQYRISGMLSQQIVLKFQKQLLKTFADKSEKCRETAIKIFKELISRCDDMSIFLPYLFSIVTERVNCQDLEGIQHLPEIMKPPPGQKPKRMIKLVEECEEIRMQLCDLMYEIICTAVNNELVQYLDDVTNIMRALAMDPCGDIQRDACKTIAAFCRNNTEMLLHFTEMLARSILLPLISKKSKVRIAALDALGAILQCGVWKYNAFVFEILVGFRDPNSVPIKDFYEPSHNINYFASIVTDTKIQVREMFLRQAGDWIIELPDKYDHHPRLIPYVLSGLFDEFPDLRRTCFDILQDAGVMEEKDKEKEIIEKKQYGVDSEWTQKGKLTNLPICEFVPERPNMGARLLVRSHVRKWWTALYKEIKESNLDGRVRASKLILIGVSYAEDYMTQFLDHFVRTLLWYTVDKNSEDQIVSKNISRAFELIGRFCPYTSYIHLIISGLKGEFSQNEDYTRATIQTLACLLYGALEATVEGEGLSKAKIEFVSKVIEVIQVYGMVETLSSHNFQQAALLLENMITMLYKHATKRQLEEMNMNGLDLMAKMGFVLNYIILFDKTFILTQSYTKEISNKIMENLTADSNNIHSNIQKIIDLQENPVEIFKEFFKEVVDSDELQFNSSNWKLTTGSILYVVFKIQTFKQNHQEQLISLVREQLGALNNQIFKTNNPEVADFLGKFALLLLTSIKENKIENEMLVSMIYNQSVSIIGQIFYWLQKTDIKISKNLCKTFQILFQECSTFGFSKNFIPLFQKAIQVQNADTMRGISQFIYQIPFNLKKYFKDQFHDIVQVVNVLITQFIIPVFKTDLKLLQNLYIVQEKEKVAKKEPSKYGQIIQFGKKEKEEEENQEQKQIEQNKLENPEQKEENEEQVQDQKSEKCSINKTEFNNANQPEEKQEVQTEKVYVIPILIQFCITCIERLGDEKSQKLVNLCFETMIEMSHLIPDHQDDYFHGEDYIIPNYSELINKIVKYTIDERDMELKKLFYKILQALVARTPYNFQKELEFSEKHQQFSRLQLFQKIINDL